MPETPNQINLEEALAIIVAQPCQTSTSPSGCLGPGSGRYVNAMYGHNTVCNPCLVRAAESGDMAVEWYPTAVEVTRGLIKLLSDGGNESEATVEMIVAAFKLLAAERGEGWRYDR